MDEVKRINEKMSNFGLGGFVFIVGLSLLYVAAESFNNRRKFPEIYR